MRRWLSIFVFAAFWFPEANSAQPFAQETSPPLVTAANEPWQINGEPLLFDGLVYRAGGPTVFFEGNVMARSGVYKGIPIYQDRTLEPYSVIFVPIGGNLMRRYERERVGELAGTSGSTALSALPRELPDELRIVGTAGNSVDVRAGSPELLAAIPPVSDTTPRRIESEPPPFHGVNGIWVPFEGRRWFVDGQAESYSPERFIPAGTSNGAVVYRERNGSPNRIWVPVVTGDLLTPYSTR